MTGSAEEGITARFEGEPTGYPEDLKIEGSIEQLDSFLNSLHWRIEKICELLGEEYGPYSLEGGMIEIEWEDYRCSCCPPDRGSHSFPSEYLTMPDEKILETEKGKKAEAERRRKEREMKERKAQALRSAQARLQRAKSNVNTAQSKAEKELKEAQRELERLQGT